MLYPKPVHSCAFIFVFFLTTLWTVPSRTARADEPQGLEPQMPGFPVQLADDIIDTGSPTIADITGDGQPEIIVGSTSGQVYAIPPGGGAPLWVFATRPAFNALPGTTNTPTTIRSAPAVANLDGVGLPEIVVAVGEITSARENGGVVVLRANGTLFPGWPQLTRDIVSITGGSDGIFDGVVESPTVADVTGDGVPEIIYGATDQHIWVKRPNGSDLPGWPKNVRDTVWSTPAVGDLDRDGIDDLVIGIDAHNDPKFGDLEGGYVKAFRGDGSELPGWPQHQDDIVDSSPTLADLDHDGSLEVVVGGGGYYDSLRPDPRGRYVTTYRANGTIMWRRPTESPAAHSPALGDINGDRQVDVVIVAQTDDEASHPERRKVYAWDGKTGDLLWTPVTPINLFRAPEATGGVILADFDGDAINDVIVAVGGQVVVLNGRNGAHLTPTSNPPDERPGFLSQGSILNVPAVGDLNNDGQLEVVAVTASGGFAAPGLVNVWTLPRSTGIASWPMFQRDPAHTGHYEEPRDLAPLLQVGTQRSYPLQFPGAWTAVEHDPSNIVTLNRTQGSRTDRLRLTVQAPNSLNTFEAWVTVQVPSQAPLTIRITLKTARTVSTVSVPLVLR